MAKKKEAEKIAPPVLLQEMAKVYSPGKGEPKEFKTAIGFVTDWDNPEEVTDHLIEIRALKNDLTKYDKELGEYCKAKIESGTVFENDDNCLRTIESESYELDLGMVLGALDRKERREFLYRAMSYLKFDYTAYRKDGAEKSPPLHYQETSEMLNEVVLALAEDKRSPIKVSTTVSLRVSPLKKPVKGKITA